MVLPPAAGKQFCCRRNCFASARPARRASSRKTGVCPEVTSGRKFVRARQWKMASGAVTLRHAQEGFEAGIVGVGCRVKERQHFVAFARRQREKAVHLRHGVENIAVGAVAKAFREKIIFRFARREATNSCAAIGETIAREPPSAGCGCNASFSRERSGS